MNLETSNKDRLDHIFSDLRTYLDKMDGIREQLLPMQRQTVRWCSEIIKNIHRGDLTPNAEKFTLAKTNLLEMRSLLSQAPGTFAKDYVHLVNQEYGEAFILNHLIQFDRFPTTAECDIGLVEYAYALADVVGELRRYVLKCIRNEDAETSIKVLDYMGEIYGYLFTLDYPNGLVPGLRKKTDMVRNILAKTEGDVTVSLNLIRLNTHLRENQNLPTK